jgi:hypothetical protein
MSVQSRLGVIRALSLAEALCCLAAGLGEYSIFARLFSSTAYLNVGVATYYTLLLKEVKYAL